ncbi:hypothetical protein G4B88_009658 [Cannabis sativa]|uniref:Uncharacterized protein n=1 Tax=Cannabis sativa TaxID=3483 RepID=A0A7J6EEB5_CANSA|nr:hypothetical protein G4B88_009658 [Cannabis sativa]
MANSNNGVIIRAQLIWTFGVSTSITGSCETTHGIANKIATTDKNTTTGYKESNMNHTMITVDANEL